MTSSRLPDNEDNNGVRKTSDFSIDHILNRAGSRERSKSDFLNERDVSMPFPWLQCTRYSPPKIPRSQRRDGPQKRQLGRHPRIPFTSQQISILEERFHKNHYLSSEEVTQLSIQLELPDVRVKIWFQNRRARERRERTLNDSKATNSSLEAALTSPPRYSPQSLQNEVFVSNPNNSRQLATYYTEVFQKMNK